MESEVIIMAGLLGFEPRYDGIKTRCLTAWRQPSVDSETRLVKGLS
jgi:hypothetical protein